MKKTKLLTLFFVFLKLGAITFGGGLAMIPIIKNEMLKRSWIDEPQLNDYITVAQIAPGMIAINIAVLIGRHIKGVLGSFIAVLGVSIPSITIIILIASLLEEFSSLTIVTHALQGIIVVVVILLFSAVINLGKKAIKNWGLLIYAFVSFLLVYLYNVSTILIILSAFLIGAIHAFTIYRKKADL